MLARIRQIAVATETVEGTPETLTAADAKLLAIDPKIEPDPGVYDRNPVRTHFSRVGKIFGKKVAKFSFGLEMRGSGTATTEPFWTRALKACGWGTSTFYSITIGAITGGPFLHGETIHGGTSEAYGRVVIAVVNGTTTLYFVSTSTATFQSGEVITGATSGATATTGSLPSAAGKVAEIIHENVPSLTSASYEGESSGIRKLLSGARGTVKFSLGKSGEPGIMNFEFMAVDNGVIDSAIFSGIVHETAIPPIFVSAALTIGGYAAKLSQLELDMACALGPRDDVNEAEGVTSFIINDRKPSGTFDPEMVLVATHDFYGRWYAGTEGVLDFTLGSVSGNKFRFYAPKVQYTKVSDEDREGIKIAQCSFDLNGSIVPGNDELCILFL